MKYILSHPRLTRSARPLAKRLSELTGEEIIVSTIPKEEHVLVIRYGNSAEVYNSVAAINEAGHIKLAGNKLRLSQLLREEGFPHVEFHNMFGEEFPDRFPVVVRKELNRGGGIGIVVCENMEQFTPYITKSWTYWYNFQFELGVHILDGKVVRVFKKVRETGLEEEKYPIRNTQRGYSFKLRENWQEKYRGLQKFVDKLYEIIPIQFARLDVGYDKETGGYRLIEINSAPDLSQNVNTLNMYAEFLANKI